jgi:ribosome-associated heat shock protein Hsp15
MGSGEPVMTALRIDKLLWFLRFAKSRSLAQNVVELGHLRLNGSRVTRCAHGVAVGDRLVLPLGTQVRVIEIVTLPSRRGPAAEAAACYRVLDETPAYPIAARRTEAANKEDLQP